MPSGGDINWVHTKAGSNHQAKDWYKIRVISADLGGGGHEAMYTELLVRGL